LGEHEEVGVQRNDVLVFGDAADEETKTHEHYQTQETDHQHFGKCEPSVGEREPIHNGTKSDKHNGGEHLKDNPSKAFAQHDVHFFNGRGKHALEYQGFPQGEKHERHPKNSGTNE